MELQPIKPDEGTKKPSRDATADPHPSFGLKANRGCTDVFCLLVFVIFWGAFGFMASVVFKQGDPNRIIYGTDWLGNNCGHGTVNVDNLGSDPWTTRTLVWYPIQFSTATEASINSDTSIGVCVRTCPKKFVPFWGYAPPGTKFYQIPFYVPLYDSTPVLNRCVPDVKSLACTSFVNCNALALNTSVSVPASASHHFSVESAHNRLSVREYHQLADTLAPQTSAPATPTPTPPLPGNGSAAFSIGGAASLRDMANNSIQELSTSWWVILVGAVIAVLLSFVWLFVLRRTVKPLVVGTGFVLLIVLVLGGVVCFLLRKKALDDPNSDPDTPKYWLAGAIAFWVVSFLYLCIVLYIFRNIMTACDIIEEASKVPIKIPSMVFVPLVLFLVVIPFLILLVIVAMYIQSCGDVISVTAPKTPITGMFFKSIDNTSFTNSSAQNSTLTAGVVQLQNWRIPAHLFNIFMFLWMFGIINAVGFMIISMCAVFWYFSEPGDHKSPPLGSVLIAFKTVLRYHLGTIFVGAFLVAFVQILRIILLVVEKKMSETLKKNDTVKGLIAVLHCILACLERLIKFINKNVYIMTAIQGSNFIESAQKALSLLIANALTVGAITVISEFVMIFGKLLITGLATFAGFGILKARNGDATITSGVLILALIAIFSFFVATLFVNIFSVCIDTILLCYCIDKAEGGPKHYFPSDLDIHVNNEAKKSGIPIAPPGGKEVPLLQDPHAQQHLPPMNLKELEL